MKFKILIAVLVAFGCNFFNSIQAQILDEGNFLIEGYIGFPNLYTSVLRSTYINETTGVEQNIKVGGVGPIGMRGEYIITDKFGIGFDVNYSDTYISWEETYSGTKYNYKVSVPRLRAMGKFNYHYVQTDKIDAYASFGAGYGSLKYIYETNDPDYINNNEDFPIPVSFRLAAGARYFFMDDLGVNLEFGLFGGALFHAGLSYKL